MAHLRSSSAVGEVGRLPGEPVRLRPVLLPLMGGRDVRTLGTHTPALTTPEGT